jgi:hypothetical protein
VAVKGMLPEGEGEPAGYTDIFVPSFKPTQLPVRLQGEDPARQSGRRVKKIIIRREWYIVYTEL